MKRLLAYFERITNSTVVNAPEVTVVTKYGADLFKNALVSVTPCDDVYSTLCKSYAEIGAGTEYFNGNDKQWMYLADQLEKYSNMSGVSNAFFGTTVNLSSCLSEVIEEEDEDKYWILWLCMKLFRGTSNKYLDLVMQKSKSVTDFEEHIYMDILTLNHDLLSYKSQ